jgi:hypothetical protein
MMTSTNHHIFKEVLVYGNFDVVAQINKEDSSIEAISCTCGWNLPCNGITDKEAIEEAKEHGKHEDYIKTSTLYIEGTLSYEGALGFLVMIGMNEDKAEEYLDGFRYVT